MRIPRFAAAASLLAVTGLAAVLTPSAGAHQQVIGGNRVSTTQYPYVVYLAKRTGFQFCGGTLVAPRKVVTAAHCATGQNPADVQVVAGRDDKQSSAGTVVDVARIWVHPNFTDVSSGADVAVLTLATALNRRAAALAAADPAPGTPGTILGWGRVAEGGPTSRYLLGAVVPVVADADCARSYHSFAAASMICAGYPDGGVDTCLGDSGGPLLADGTLFGIASWGTGCARPDKPGVYTRVSRYAGLITGQL